MVGENPSNIQDWLTDHEGRLRLATTTDGVNTSILYRERESDSFKLTIAGIRGRSSRWLTEDPLD